jgi:hypothetical protein
MTDHPASNPSREESRALQLLAELSADAVGPQRVRWRATKQQIWSDDPPTIVGYEANIGRVVVLLHPSALSGAPSLEVRRAGIPVFREYVPWYQQPEASQFRALYELAGRQVADGAKAGTTARRQRAEDAVDRAIRELRSLNCGDGRGLSGASG